MTVQTGIEVVGKSSGDDVLAQMVADAKASRESMAALNGTLQETLKHQRELAAAAASAAAAAKVEREEQRKTKAAAAAAREAARAADEQRRHALDVQREYREQAKDVGAALIKVGQLGAQAFMATARAALEARAATDPTRRSIEASAKAAKEMQIAAGDALLVPVRALGEAIRPVVASATAWLKANRELVGTRLTEWATGAARVLTSVLSVAVGGVVRIWYGWKLAINTVAMAVETAFASVLQGSAKAAGALARLAGAAGADGLAANLRGVSDSAARMGGTFGGAAEKAAQELAKDAAEMRRLLGGIDAVELAIDKALSKTGVGAARALGDAVQRARSEVRALAGDADGAYQVWVRLNTEAAKQTLGTAARDAGRGISWMTEQQYRHGVALAESAQTQQQYTDGVKELRGEYGGLVDTAIAATGSIAGARKALADARQEMRPMLDLANAGMGVLGNAASGLLNDIIDQAKSATEIIGSFFESIGRGVLNSLLQIGLQHATNALVEAIVGSAVRTKGTMGYVAQAAAAAYASTAAIPVVGPALAPGVAAAAGAGALGAAAATGGLGLAKGGLIRGGGAPGRDSVPALLAPGELVTPYREVQANVAAGRAPGDSGLPRRGETRPITIDARSTSFVPESSASFARRMEVVERVQRKAARRSPR